jgi:hypothetical protein
MRTREDETRGGGRFRRQRSQVSARSTTRRRIESDDALLLFLTPARVSRSLPGTGSPDTANARRSEESTRSNKRRRRRGRSGCRSVKSDARSSERRTGSRTTRAAATATRNQRGRWTPRSWSTTQGSR